MDKIREDELIKSAIGVLSTNLKRRQHDTDCFCVHCSADKQALSALKTIEWIKTCNVNDELIGMKEILDKFTDFGGEV